MEDLTIAEAANRLNISEKTLRRWVHTGKINARIENRRFVFSLADVEAHTSSPSNTMRIEVLEKRLDALERQIETMLKYTSLHHEPPLQSPGLSMPGGLVGWRSFSQRHGIAASTVQKAIETGRLSIIAGEWKVGRATVKGAFDQRGRAKFYSLYHEHSNFKPCANCPHEE